MTRLSIPAALLLIACEPGPEPNVQYPYCQDAAVALAPDEVSPLGFSGEDWLAAVSGSFTAAGTWTVDGATTDVTVEVVPTGTVSFVDSEPVYPTEGTVPAIGVVCEDRMEVSADVTVTTADGAFAEAFSGPFTGMTGAEGTARAELDPEALTGTWTTTGYDTSAADVVRLAVDVHTGSAPSGAVSLHTEGSSSGTGSTGTAWAAQETVLQWPISE